MDLSCLVTLAQALDRYNDGVRGVQWGTTIVGVAVMMTGAALFFSKAKPNTSSGMQTFGRIIAAVFVVAGIAIIAYAWLGFSTV